MIRAFPTFPILSPDFARTLPKARNTVFGVLPYVFRCEESIATIPETIRALPTIPEMIRALPTFPELSRRLETPCLMSFHIFLGARNRLRLFPKRSEPSRSYPNSPRSLKPPCVAAGHAVGSEAATT
ncbi:hypothetical protein NQ317_003594 [Molorchus minor]|uniref:Uncharacterized protein n=1 Tax=Molorchus minor TaxID=1323400 RepID=A0ABQ9IRM7_9CUCU|nr:hypothetical protein NQ317_003594 [Molorchus minor]